MRLGSLVVIVWLLIGVFAAYQRDYLARDNDTCAKAGTVALTVVAGPLNYLGLNPKVGDCDVPEPSR